MVSTDESRPSVKLKDFEPLSEVGSGLAGTTYGVRHTPTGALYALKVMDKSHLQQNNQLKRAVAEQAMLSEMQHPFVVNMILSFQTTHKLYLLMELAKGGSLDALLKRETLSPRAVQMLTAQLVGVLQYLHEQKGIIHRDIKPDNILLDTRGCVKLADFGLSRQGHLQRLQVNDMEHFSFGSQYIKFDESEKFVFCVGTAAYLSPEMLLGESHNFAVDWWALGCVLFELLGGGPAFAAPSSQDTLLNIYMCQVPYDRLPENVSKEARDLLSRLLEKHAPSRLGSHGGAEEIKKHPYFDGVDWDSLTHPHVWLPFESCPLLPALSRAQPYDLRVHVYDDGADTATLLFGRAESLFGPG